VWDPVPWAALPEKLAWRSYRTCPWFCGCRCGQSATSCAPLDIGFFCYATRLHSRFVSSPFMKIRVKSMTSRIEDYALIGDCKSAALVGCDGSIDWLCWPRFDSPACFAGLLGNSENGRWLIRPRQPVVETRRRYRPGTLVLDTEFRSSHGSAVVTDFMIPGDGAYLVRIVTGLRGRLEFRAELIMRFDYGATVPWVTRLDDGGLSAIAGPDRLVLWTTVLLWTLFSESAFCGRCVRRASTNRRVLARLERALPGRESVDGRSQAFADHPQGADLCSDWRNRRCGDNVLAGIHRRNSKLGLPLLLAPRCHVHTARANASRLLRGGPGLAELAAARGRR